ncbi:MAG: DUF3084 domain-containing protein [Armatimonadota bacterium]|nr:DUF3084 domain-containing protein [Armatimonadota bacterium]
MRYTILFVAVVILVSGFIAYFGDQLGRWMGKRRLTLWRLRPRHTAYAVTAVTGMLIAAFTLAALVSVNSQFKRLLTEGEHILARNVELTHRNEQLAARIRLLEQKRDELRREVDRQRREVAAAREAALRAADARVKAERARVKAEAAVKRLQEEIAARQRDLERLTRSRDEAEAKLREKAAELARLQNELAKVRADLEVAQKNVTIARAQQAEALKRLADAQSRLSETNQKLADAQKLLQDQQKAIAEQQETLRLQQQAIVELGKARLQAERAAMEFERKLIGGDIRFRQGDEIARGTISPRQSVFGIKGDLFSLLDTASQRALERGAGIGPNGRAVAVEFTQPVGTDYVVRIENESTCVQMAAEAIAQSAFQPYDALVQVVCSRNSLAGEQVRVKLVLYYNTLAYRKGDKIAETKLDGRVSEGRVLLALISFLQNEVSKAAVKAGIIPVANPDPRMSLGSDPRSQVEALMAVVERIKAVNAKVNVEVYASSDIFAAGPLNMNNMRFSISKAE